ncbi:MAG TPA: hypothetical protein VEW46_19410 [Pyrinomonadaceae bacterium]|nr:hypothetical protein [Pyrinomonadaceae bacterium]
MKKKIVGAFAMVSLLASIALGVAVNSSDEVSLGLPGDYSVQISTHYVGSERMRSFSFLNASSALTEVEAECVADVAAQASQAEILEAECVADATALASQNAIVEAEAECVADVAANASQGAIVAVESECVSDVAAKAVSSLL